MRTSNHKFFDTTYASALPSQYAINMAWINQTLNPEQRYVYPCSNEKELIDTFLVKVEKWTAANPEADVAIWYDSRFTSEKAVRATQEVLDKEMRFSKIRLRDIRDLDVVKTNPDSFSDMVPIYTRVDLIKLILCVNSIESEGKDAAIFSDLDVGDLRPDKGRMDKDQLFKPQVMKKLNEFGLELGIDGMGNAENKFIQVLNKSETLTALKLTIDASLLRIVTTLNATNKHGKPILQHLNSGTVFVALKEHTTNLIYGLLAREDNKKIKINLQAFGWERDEEWVEYDPMVHGCIPLGNIYLGNSGGDYGTLLEKDNQDVIKSIYTTIALPESYPEYKLGRDDTDTRCGRAHSVKLDNINLKKPENGDKFHCEFLIPPQIEHKSTHEYM